VNQTFSDLSVNPTSENVFNFNLQSFSLSLSIDSESALAGSEVRVSFEDAPAQSGDYITIVPVDMPDNVLLDTERPDEASGIVSLRTPDEVTLLEARYLTRSENGSRTVIARSEPFSTEALTITLDAPSEVNAGSGFEVTWSGASNPQDFITIVPATDPDRTVAHHKRAREGQAFTLDAPVIEGDYELRYVTSQSRIVIARLAIKVLAVSVSLEAVDAAQAGSSIEIAYSGAANEQDFITIVPVDAPDNQVDSHKRVREGNPLGGPTPSEPGEYEIRYVTNQSPRQVLARLPLNISGLSVSLNAAETVAAGTTLEVSFTGASNEQDFITIVPSGSPENTVDEHRRVREGNPAVVNVISIPGEYEIRYVTNQSPRTVFASIPLTVTALEVSLEAANEARAGSTVEVSHLAGGNENDFITIVPIDSEARQVDNHRRLKEGNPVSILVPDIPGLYEIRYVTNQAPRTVYASLPFTISDLAISLSAAPTVLVGETVMVTLTGEANPDDFVTIVPVGSADREVKDHRRVKDLARGIIAPQEPGNYEIRYVTSQSRRVVTSIPITIQ